VYSTTAKPFNFGPHGNFRPLFQKGFLSLNRVLRKTEENKSCRKTLDLQIRFCSFSVHDSSTEATELARKVQSFHEVQRGFYGTNEVLYHITYPNFERDRAGRGYTVTTQAPACNAFH
jgi:hypothetical protein